MSSLGSILQNGLLSCHHPNRLDFLHFKEFKSEKEILEARKLRITASGESTVYLYCRILLSTVLQKTRHCTGSYSTLELQGKQGKLCQQAFLLGPWGPFRKFILFRVFGTQHITVSNIITPRLQHDLRGLTVTNITNIFDSNITIVKMYGVLTTYLAFT